PLPCRHLSRLRLHRGVGGRHDPRAAHADLSDLARGVHRRHPAAHFEGEGRPARAACALARLCGVRTDHPGHHGRRPLHDGPTRHVTGIRDFEYAGWRVGAPSCDGSAAATALFVAPLLQAAKIKPGTRLLDVACGTGVASAQAAALGARVTGVDFPPEMIAEAKKRHPAIAFHIADAEQLPFADASFDAVVANFGIHHVERPQRAIAQARRVLAPGGIFAFTFWAAPQENTAWRLIFEAIAAHGRTDVPMPAGNDAHATPENFSRLVADAGFDARTLRCELIEKDWELPRETDLVAVFETGTVRMATLLRGQGGALPAIRRHVAVGVRPFLRGQIVALPTRAWLIAARASLFFSPSPRAA